MFGIEKGERMYYSAQQVAELTGYHPETIRRWMRSGKLNHVGTGKLKRVPKGELEKFMESLGSGESQQEIPELSS